MRVKAHPEEHMLYSQKPQLAWLSLQLLDRILKKNGKQAPLFVDVAGGHLLKSINWPLAQEPPGDT